MLRLEASIPSLVWREVCLYVCRSSNKNYMSTNPLLRPGLCQDVVHWSTNSWPCVHRVDSVVQLGPNWMLYTQQLSFYVEAFGATLVVLVFWGVGWGWGDFLIDNFESLLCKFGHNKKNKSTSPSSSSLTSSKLSPVWPSSHWSWTMMRREPSSSANGMRPSGPRSTTWSSP